MPKEQRQTVPENAGIMCDRRRLLSSRVNDGPSPRTRPQRGRYPADSIEFESPQRWGSTEGALLQRAGGLAIDLESTAMLSPQTRSLQISLGYQVPRSASELSV